VFATQRSTWKDGTDYPMDSRLGDVSHLRPMAKHEKKPSFVVSIGSSQRTNLCSATSIAATI